MARLGRTAREAWQCVADFWFSDEMHNRFHDACAAADISPPQLKALLSLEPGQVQPMRDLAETWRCDASWVTGIVDGLEERGYVERQPHPRDRRVKMVAITPLGDKAKAKALDVLHDPPQSMAKLNGMEQRALRDLLRKMSTTD